jgi:hypothetical protein
MILRKNADELACCDDLLLCALTYLCCHTPARAVAGTAVPAGGHDGDALGRFVSGPGAALGAREARSAAAGAARTSPLPELRDDWPCSPLSSRLACP